MATGTSRCDNHHHQSHGADCHHRRSPPALDVVIETRRRQDRDGNVPDMAPPLTAEESSLRWPLQHQFTLGVHGKHPDERTTDGQTELLDSHTQWLTIAAHLTRQAFHQITHPPERSFLGVPLPMQETWDMYAQYYDAMIHATESGQSALPVLHALAATMHRGTWRASPTPTPSSRTGAPSTLN